jgi:hypothetical protein
MKKFIFLFFMLFTATLSFVSCDKSENEEEVVPPDETPGIAEYSSFANANGDYGYIIRYKGATSAITLNDKDNYSNALFYNANTNNGVIVIGELASNHRRETVYINRHDSLYYGYSEIITDFVDSRLSSDYVGYFGTPDEPIIQKDSLYTYKRYIAGGGSGYFPAGHGTYIDSIIWTIPDVVYKTLTDKLDLAEAIERADKRGRYNLAVFFGIK